MDNDAAKGVHGFLFLSDEHVGLGRAVLSCGCANGLFNGAQIAMSAGCMPCWRRIDRVPWHQLWASSVYAGAMVRFLRYLVLVVCYLWQADLDVDGECRVLCRIDVFV